MIRAVLLLLLVVSAATLLGLAVAEHSGYVLIAWKGLRYESSLWVFLLLLALAWGLFVGVRWLVRVLLASGGVVNPWSRRIRGKRQQHSLLAPFACSRDRMPHEAPSPEPGSDPWRNDSCLS